MPYNEISYVLINVQEIFQFFPGMENFTVNMARSQRLYDRCPLRRRLQGGPKK